MPHTDSADWAQGCLIIPPNPISPRGQRSGCWVTQKMTHPQVAALKEESQPVGWLSRRLSRAQRGRAAWVFAEVPLGCRRALHGNELMLDGSH